jgi:hypothetical protein
MVSQHRVTVALNLPRSVPNLIKLGKSIVQSMTGNTWFSSPNPTLTNVSAGLEALETSETTVKARTKGAVEARNVKYVAATILLRQLRDYVQQVADAHMADAEAIIQSAGMGVKKSGKATKAPLAASAGVVSGAVHLAAQAAAARAANQWEWSLDGKTWNVAPTTLQAKTTIVGLTPGALVYFRHRPVTKAGEGDWSQVVSVIVK